MSDSVRPQRRQPTRLPRPWDYWKLKQRTKYISVWKIWKMLFYAINQPQMAICECAMPPLFLCVLCLVTQSCLTLCDPMDCSSPGSSVHGILQARILEWVAYPFSRRSSQPKNQTGVSCTAGGFFISWATRNPHSSYRFVTWWFLGSFRVR